MNITEEKWSMQQNPQVPQSPHQTHPPLSPQMSSISTEPFMPPFPYEGQTPQAQIQNPQMQANDGNNVIVTPKQEIATPQSFVAMPAPVTRQNVGSPVTSTASNPVPPEQKIDNRRAFTTSSFHAAPFQSTAVRKRRDNTVNFSDVGSFFLQTQQHFNLYSTDRTTSYKICINSKVDRGFFLADNDWTCYRRNYFQISSAFSVTCASHPLKEPDVQCLIEANGQFLPVTQFSLGISARVSNSDKKIDLVQHTPKRDKGPQMVPLPKPIRPGGNLNLSSVGSNSNLVTFERIQFKTATANNGKRRAAQQYYVIIIELYAQTESCDNYLVATTVSAPLVVRGRSPGHYADSSERFSPMAMHPSYPNDGRHHMNFPHSGPNGSPGMISADFSGPHYPGAYGQYPPFQGFSQIMIPTNPTTSEASPFHQHQPHYIVHNMSQTGDSQNNDMFNNHNIDPNNLEVPTATSSAFSNYESRPASANPTSDGKPPLMKIEIPQTSQLSNHPLTSPAFHSQEYVEGFHVYNHNGHPANAAATQNGGYHSDSEQNNSNGSSKQLESAQENPIDERSEIDSPQLNNEKTDPSDDSKSDDASSKSPLSASENRNVTIPTTPNQGKASA
ncbi:11961_t:CDS:2 [Acaulospora morrowiae]|uniref:11961_t:CDS:1 n=1 Tax=Acaulospora morrowiae TaxID=94023 RepID=A0A9N9B8C0_9GLOM|nr:11961_t:CDS:2 [Acaulospora morrowiae]